MNPVPSSLVDSPHSQVVLLNLVLSGALVVVAILALIWLMRKAVKRRRELEAFLTELELNRPEGHHHHHHDGHHHHGHSHQPGHSHHSHDSGGHHGGGSDGGGHSGGHH